MRKATIVKRNEMDRPTHNSLQYLTRVKPHYIQRENFLVDPFVLDTLTQSLGVDVVKEFGDYTRSYYTLEGHYSNLWKYDTEIQPKPSDPRLNAAMIITRNAFRLSTPVTSIGWNDLKSVPFISSSSAGWGFIGKKGDPGNNDIAIARAVKCLNMWLEDERDGTSIFRYHPDLAWTRTQLGTVEDPKIRNVWGKAFDNIILEGMSAAPLIEAYRIRSDPMPIGINYFRKLPTMISHALYDGNTHKYGVGLDISSFDACVEQWMIRYAFDVLRDNIIFPDYMSSRAYDYSEHFFIHTPVVMPDGRLWLTHKGVPSGSYFTQLIDSIVNHLACTYAQLCVYGQVFDTSVLGDDSLFGIPVDLGYPTIESFTPAFKRLGFTLSEAKSIVATRPDQLYFLGHCCRHSKVDRETAGMMRLALFPEHPVDGPTTSLNRIKGIMLDSALNSWPIIHLHDLMMMKWRNELDPSLDEFRTTEKDWYQAVLGIGIPPSQINTITTFTLT